MIPKAVTESVDTLVEKDVIPQEYRDIVVESVDVEMRRKARLLGSTIGRAAITAALMSTLADYTPSDPPEVPTAA